MELGLVQHVRREAVASLISPEERALRRRARTELMLQQAVAPEGVSQIDQAAEEVLFWLLSETCWLIETYVDRRGEAAGEELLRRMLSVGETGYGLLLQLRREVATDVR
jgi:hypothetical protein